MKTKKNQKELVEIINTAGKMKDDFNKIINKLDVAEKKNH